MVVNDISQGRKKLRLIDRFRAILRRWIMSILGVNTAIVQRESCESVTIPKGPVILFAPDEVEFTPAKMVEVLEENRILKEKVRQYRGVAEQAVLDLRHINRTYGASYAKRREIEVQRELSAIEQP